MRPKYSIQRSLHCTSWLHYAKSFVCFTAICLGRGMTKITHSLLLLVPLFQICCGLMLPLETVA